MPPKRMTANPVRPARHRAGKPLAQEASSSSDEDSDDADADTVEKETSSRTAPRQAAPKATSFPSGAAKAVTKDLRNVDLDERRKRAQAEEEARRREEFAERDRMERDAGFVTESEDEDGDEEAGTATSKGPEASSEEEEEDSSEEEESSSSDDAKPPPRIAPKFIPKHQRGSNTANTSTEQDAVQKQKEEAARRQAELDAAVQSEIEARAAARAAATQAFDEESLAVGDESYVDDTDGLDPELERQQWVARELGRLKRAREALEEREKELAEIERRKNLTAEEREREDAEHIAAQKEEQEGRGKMAYLQKYHHKGAFFQDDPKDKELFERDLMGATYQDQSAQREALPQFLQVRDATKIGKKGQTRYRDLKSEDTGRWGDFGRDGKRAAPRGVDKDGPFVADERFRPDRPSGGAGATGANASFVGDRKRPNEERDAGKDKRPRLDSRD